MQGVLLAMCYGITQVKRLWDNTWRVYTLNTYSIMDTDSTLHTLLLHTTFTSSIDVVLAATLNLVLRVCVFTARVLSM